MIKDSPIHGKGVFATRSFRKGVTISTAHYLIVKGNDSLYRYVTGCLKMFNCKDNEYLLILGDYVKMNHRVSDVNVQWVYKSNVDTYVCITTRAIRSGEELVHNYGSDYWEYLNEIPKT